MNVWTVFALVGLAIAIGLVVAGVLRVLAAYRTLKARIDGYAALPILRTYDETLGRVFLARRAVANAPTLVGRLEDAMALLAFARARLELAGAEALVMVRQIPAILFGLA